MKELTISPIGGLANRMRAMASGVALAQHLGRPAKVIWSANSELRTSFSELFETPNMPSVRIVEIGPATELFLYDEARKKNLYISAIVQKFSYGRTFFDILTPEGSYNSITEVDTATLADSSRYLIRSGQTFSDYTRELFIELFTPRQEIIDNVDRVISPNPRLTGLHIRRTDNQRAISRSPDSLFFKKTDEILSIDPKRKFYLASDSQTVKEDFLSRYGKETIITSLKPVTRGSTEGMRDALVEMLILSKCEEIFGSFWSSYAEVAAYYGNVPLHVLSL